MAMETVALNRSMSSSSYKQNRMMGRRCFPNSYENVAPIHGGLLQPPHPLIPFSSSSSSFNPSLFNHYMQQLLIHNLQQQPPLLPLPKTLHRSLPSRTRSLSRPPTTRETNNATSQSLTPKKPAKSKALEAKKINNMNRLGTDPKDLPQYVAKVMSSSSGKSNTTSSVVVGNKMDNFSSPIFLLAPPPSSLPLPRFTMKSAKGCKAENGVGVDAGATDILCRLMRIR